MFASVTHRMLAPIFVVLFSFLFFFFFWSLPFSHLGTYTVDWHIFLKEQNSVVIMLQWVYHCPPGHAQKWEPASTWPTIFTGRI